MSNKQVNKLKSGIKNITELTLTLSSNLIRNPNDQTNFLHKLLTDTIVSKIRRNFANGLSAKINFSKSQLCRMI